MNALLLAAALAYPFLFPDPLDDLSRFPTIGDVDAIKDGIRIDRDFCVRELSPPYEGGPLVDPSCQPEWTAFWEMRRDAAIERLAAWQDLYDAEFAMYPDRCYPSTPVSLEYLAERPVSADEWDCWRRRARLSLTQLRQRIGESSYAMGKMP